MCDGCPTRALSVIIGGEVEVLGVFYLEGMVEEELDAYVEVLA
jgi:hypothetical protein